MGDGSVPRSQGFHFRMNTNVHATTLKLRGQRLISKLKHAGISRYCPVCRSAVSGFNPHGNPRREDAICPVCLCRDRHRLAWLYLLRETRLFKASLAFLHVAPELEMARWWSAMPTLRYLSIDLFHPAMMKMDLGRLEIPDQSIDMLYCSHVLNMLPDDRPAMREAFRVLSPGGLALFQVPMNSCATPVELNASSTHQQRMVSLGDPDMYRRYAPDVLVQRLTAVGFSVERVAYFHRCPPDERTRMGLIDEDLYVCRRIS